MKERQSKSLLARLSVGASAAVMCFSLGACADDQPLNSSNESKVAPPVKEARLSLAHKSKDHATGDDLTIFGYRDDRCSERWESGEPDPELDKVLMSGVQERDWDTVRLAVLQGARTPAGLTSAQGVRLRRERASAALFDAAKAGNVNAIRRLLGAGADPNVAIAMDDMATPLAWAGACNRPAAVQALIEGGARVNKSFTWSKGRAVYDSTALMFASFYGSTDAMKVLIANGADVNRATRMTNHDDPNQVGEWSLVESAGTTDARALLIAAGAKAGA